MIRENIVQLKASVADICHGINRDPQKVVIVGVTKYSDSFSIQEAIEAGITHIGENRLQQAFLKYADLANVTKHMIGHLQTNKVKQAVALFDMIQSVDSLHVAQEIDRQCAKINRTMDVLVQVNVSAEEQKFGIAANKVSDLLKQIVGCKAIHVQGLMTIGPLTEDQGRIRDCFKRLHDIFMKAQQEFSLFENIQMRYLSMGMSDDYRIALEEGSNMLRIGRAIFQ